MKIIIRPQYTFFDSEKFGFAVEYIVSTQYKIGAKDIDAPGLTDCITAVRWILAQSSDFLLPHGYIGDFPNMLTECGYSMFPLSDAQRWDLIFFERMSFTHQKYMIAHIGIMTSATEFFHSSLHFWWWNISWIHDFDYKNSILDESFLQIAKDPRNSKQ